MTKEKKVFALFSIKLDNEPALTIFNDCQWISKPLIEMDNEHLRNTANYLSREYAFSGYSGYTREQWIVIVIAMLRSNQGINSTEIVFNKIKATITYFNKKEDAKPSTTNNKKIPRPARNDGDREKCGAIRLPSPIISVADGICNTRNAYANRHIVSKIVGSQIQVSTGYSGNYES